MVYPVSSNNGTASGLLVLSSFCKLNRNHVPPPLGGGARAPHAAQAGRGTTEGESCSGGEGKRGRERVTGEKRVEEGVGEEKRVAEGERAEEERGEK